MNSSEPCVQSTKTDAILRISLAGKWDRLAEIPSLAESDVRGIEQVVFEAGGLMSWNSSLPVYILRVLEVCRARKIRVDLSGLPEGAQRLCSLAEAVPARAGAARGGARDGFFARIGGRALGVMDSVVDIFSFVGEFVQAFVRMLRGKARFRRVDLLEALSESGPSAFGIISLISVLVGTILAFIGAVQLRMFGAEIFVANLVAIGMVREMGALMTAIVMTGRTGAAFAARLGTMQVNEEVDALSTLAFDPIEFLVLPRVIAMCLMVPLLTLYSNFLGILGGAIVGIFMLDITALQYYTQTRAGMNLAGLSAGLIKSVVFALLVALCGCLNGIRCGRSALAVGEATTRAVVSGIVAIIVADSLLNIIFIVIGF